MKVRKLACILKQNPEVISVGRIGDPECLFVEGPIYGRGLKILVDTGAPSINVRPDVVKSWSCY